jgi:malate synthase
MQNKVIMDEEDACAEKHADLIEIKKILRSLAQKVADDANYMPGSHICHLLEKAKYYYEKV